MKNRSRIQGWDGKICPGIRVACIRPFHKIINLLKLRNLLIPEPGASVDFDIQISIPRLSKTIRRNFFFAKIFPRVIFYQILVCTVWLSNVKISGSHNICTLKFNIFSGFDWHNPARCPPPCESENYLQSMVQVFLL